MVYLGIDVGGTGIKIGVVDQNGCILAQGETPTHVGRPFADIVRDMGLCALDVLKKGGFSTEDVVSIGVGVPGVANQEDGHGGVSVPTWHWHECAPAYEELQKYIDKPVYIDNDATVAGYAESICGVSKGCHSSVFLTLGTGVGGGIVIDGRPWSGFHGIGSEIGHIPMDIDGELCTCGNRGCLERYCSATAIIRMGQRKPRLDNPDQRPVRRVRRRRGASSPPRWCWIAPRQGDSDCGRGVWSLCQVHVPCAGHHHRVSGSGDDHSGRRREQARAASYWMPSAPSCPKYLLFKALPFSRIENARNWVRTRA